MQLIAYLTFNGDCEEALRYYEKHLRGKIEAMIPHEGTPAENHVPESHKKKIMHARLAVGDAVLMASDAPPQYYAKPQGMSVSINIDDPKEGERIFSALADGGETTMPYGETFWAKGFGMCADRFGTRWMVNAGQQA